jgi:hypothetical protein
MKTRTENNTENGQRFSGWLQRIKNAVRSTPLPETKSQRPSQRAIPDSWGLKIPKSEKDRDFCGAIP